MKVAVVNGSPKGKNSVTLQTTLYLRRLFPEDGFEIIHAGQAVKKLERDAEELARCIDLMRRSDLVLFSYPVYTFIAPSQLHRFIELLKENGADFTGVKATQITTSKHFYDFTAHACIELNLADMGFSVIKGLSADMEDLLSGKGRKAAVDFWKYVHFASECGISAPPARMAPERRPAYRASAPAVPKEGGGDTVLVTNRGKDDQGLSNMIADFIALHPHPVRLVDINDFPFAGGCLGCFNCASDGACIYTDGFDTFLRERIQSADAILYAFTIRDHCMGASFKRYDDRQFCNGHRAVTMGKPTGYIVRGDWSREDNLRTIIQARCEVGGNFLAYVATDESGDDAVTRADLEKLSRAIRFALETRISLPSSFLGVGGAKIFRDLIYVMRGLMREDHRFYKRHGIYDFPHKQVGTIMRMQLLGSLMSISPVRSKMRGRMTEAILAPYKAVTGQAGE